MPSPATWYGVKSCRAHGLVGRQVKKSCWLLLRRYRLVTLTWLIPSTSKKLRKTEAAWNSHMCREPGAKKSLAVCSNCRALMRLCCMNLVGDVTSHYLSARAVQVFIPNIAFPKQVDQTVQYNVKRLLGNVHQPAVQLIITNLLRLEKWKVSGSVDDEYVCCSRHAFTTS